MSKLPSGLGDILILGPCLAACCGAVSAAPPFVDVTTESHIDYQVGYTRPALIGRDTLDYQIPIMTFGGAAAGDCDNDGDIDLFITYGNTGGPKGGGGPNRLYLNQLIEQGNGLLFEDRAEQAGVANSRPDGRNDRHSGPTFADMDGDGDLDLFLGGIYGDPSRIYQNEGGCVFTDVTSNSPDIENMLAPHTNSAAFGDYDLDGDLDMFLTHWGTADELYGVRCVIGGVPPAIKCNARSRETDHLWRNESDRSGIRFVNVSEESGMSNLVWFTRTYPGTPNFEFSPQFFDFTLTPTFAHINNDPWPDIAIVGDFATTQLALNNGDGTFSSLENPILRKAQLGMGSALGDIDNDGDLDWFISSTLGPGANSVTLHGNRLYRNDGGAALFTDDTAQLGVADGSWGWGACFLDIDDDGDLDIYHTNGWPQPFLGHDVWQTPAARAFVMNEEGSYTDEAQSLGLADHSPGRGIVCADFDHDGDTDILELNDAADKSATLWENRTAAAGRNFLRVELEGLPPNTAAAGARIFVRIGSRVQMREIMIGSNYTSQNPTVQIFGLDSAEAVDELVVEWPATDSGNGPRQLGTRISGPIAASRPGETLVIGQPDGP